MPHEKDALHIRHPFRQSLPIELYRIAQSKQLLEAEAPSRRQILGEDLSLFLLSFIAFFTAFYAFII